MKKTTLIAKLRTAADSTTLPKVNGLLQLVLILMLMIPFSGQAQNGYYILGGQQSGGTSVSTSPLSQDLSRNGISPFQRGRASKSQFIYKRSEFHLDPGDTSPKQIARIGFDVVESSVFQVGGSYSGSIEIRLSNYIPGNFTTEDLTGENSTVYFSGQITVTAAGVHYFDLADSINGNPFTWNGVDNILVQICQTSSSPSGSNLSVKTTKFTATNDKRTKGLFKSGSTVAGCSLVVGGPGVTKVLAAQQIFRPDAHFVFKCTSTPTSQYSGDTEASVLPSGCLGEMVVLKLVDAPRYSNQEYSWEMCDNPSVADPIWQPIAVGMDLETITVAWPARNMWYRAKIGCGAGSTANSYVLTTEKKLTVSGNNFTNGFSNGVPDSSNSEAVLMNGGDYYFANGFKACAFVINSGNVLVKAGETVEVEDAVIVSPGATLTFEEGASLVQRNPNAINQGNIKYVRHTSPVRRYDYTYWSSPVSNATLLSVSPDTLPDKFFSWNQSSQSWVNEVAATTVMTPGVGYIIRAPQTIPISGPPEEQLAFVKSDFVGVPNNGLVLVPISGSETEIKHNLIGNPYPSGLKIDDFLTQNSSIVDGTIHLWTHKTGITENNYNASDYLSYNRTGPILPKFDGIVAAGQSFMIKGIVNGTVTFTNEMRKGENNKQFFRAANDSGSNAGRITATSDRHRYWLELSGSGAVKGLLVGYIAGSTLDYDSGYDGDAMDGGTLSFSSLIGTRKLGIQGRPTPFVTTDEVPLSFTAATAGNYQIKISQFDGLFDSQDVFLNDLELGVVHNLKESPYSFQALAGENTSRFKITYESVTLSTKNPETAGNDIVVYKNNGNLKIESNVSLNKITVFDLRGRQLAIKENCNANEVTFDSPGWSEQVILLKVVTDGNISTTKKIVF